MILFEAEAIAPIPLNVEKCNFFADSTTSKLVKVTEKRNIEKKIFIEITLYNDILQ